MINDGNDFVPIVFLLTTYGMKPFYVFEPDRGVNGPNKREIGGF